MTTYTQQSVDWAARMTQVADALGLTSPELARRLDISPKALGYILARRAMPGPSTALELMRLERQAATRTPRVRQLTWRERLHGWLVSLAVRDRPQPCVCAACGATVVPAGRTYECVRCGQHYDKDDRRTWR